MDGKFSPSARRFKLYDLLKGLRRPIALTELANQFGVHYDTIRRDLDQLEEAAYHIEITRDEYDGHPLVRLRSDLLFDGPFTRHEVHTLVGLGSIVEPLRGTPVHDNYESALTKIADSLSPKERAELERTRERFFCTADGGVLPYEEKRSIVETILVAALSNRRLEYVYRTAAGNQHSGTLDPVAFGTHRSTLYLLGRPVRPKREGAPTLPPWVRWPVHRFVMASQTREEFTVPKDFKIEDHFNGWGIVAGERREHVVIEFTPRIAPLIAERVWHSTQRLDPLPDGGVRFSCDVACTPELTSWILGHGSDALVLEPLGLRDEVQLHYARAIERMLGRFPPATEANVSNENVTPSATSEGTPGHDHDPAPDAPIPVTRGSDNS